MSLKLELWWPVKPLGINQGWGVKDPKYTALGLKGHNGLDFFALDSTPVRATHDGEVTFTGEDSSGGLIVVVRTTEKFDYLGDLAYFKTVYAHLKKGTFRVKPGDKVTVGTVLALADNTGLSTGSHLHFALKPVKAGEADWQWDNIEQQNGYNGAINPFPYFNNYFAEDQAQVISIYQKIIAALKAAVDAYRK